MLTVTHIDELRPLLTQWRRAGQTIAFVPTMGNLHAGHLSLIERAHEVADKVVASIFVNPLQFGQGEDYSAYPRTLAADAQQLQAANTDILFTPIVEEMYPDENTLTASIVVKRLSNILCGKFRPGHFDGVATVVTKLFNIVQPDIAVFGKKDFQQWMIIDRMTHDLNLPVKVLGIETSREADGLAMSSRNQYLSQQERDTASIIYQTLSNMAERIKAGERCFDSMIEDGLFALKTHGLQPDYLEIRNAKDLSSVNKENQHVVILTAAKLGKARLIDNVEIHL